MKTQKSVFPDYFPSLLISVMCLLLFGFTGSSKAKDRKQSLTTRQIADRCLPSVALITVRGNDGHIIKTGSGFVVAENVIATNIHVVQDAHKVTANFNSGRSVEILGIVSEDTSSDLALVLADTSGIKPLQLAGDSPHIGDAVIALGSPEGLGGSMSTGIISGLRMIPGIKVLQTTAPISHGSSGGPLLDAGGEVLGVTSFMLQDGQNLNFAYPAYFLKLLMLNKPDNYLPWDKTNRVWRIELEKTRGLLLVLAAYDYLPHERLAKDVAQLNASGFVRSVYESLGLNLPKDIKAQAAVGYDVPKADWDGWLAGDRVYFAFSRLRIDHTGIYIGDGRFIHLSLTDHKIVVDRIDNSRFSDYLVCVRRSHELLGD